MSIPTGHRNNLATMIKAAKNNDLALLECNDIKTGAIIIAVVMISHHKDGTYQITPIAKMFDGNPYEELTPPEVP